MNARTLPFGRLLAPAHDFHGLKLDLYGTIDEDGYRIEHACVPGSLLDVSPAMSAELLATLGAALDDALPSAEQLRKQAAEEDRADRVAWNRAMTKLPNLTRLTA